MTAGIPRITIRFENIQATDIDEDKLLHLEASKDARFRVGDTLYVDKTPSERKTLTFELRVGFLAYYDVLKFVGIAVPKARKPRITRATR